MTIHLIVDVPGASDEMPLFDDFGTTWNELVEKVTYRLIPGNYAGFVTIHSNYLFGDDVDFSGRFIINSDDSVQFTPNHPFPHKPDIRERITAEWDEILKSV